MESQRLLTSKEEEVEEEQEDSLEGEWSDRSSYSTYSDSDSDSIIPDWEPYVNDFTGELLYIDCHPFVTHNRYQSKAIEEPEPFSKSQLRRSTRGKFLRLLRRRESKRLKKNQKTIEEGIEINTQKVKFQDFQEGEQKEVTLEIDRENRYNLSSDKSLAESLLGVIVGTLLDGHRVMISGFSYDSKAKNDRNIKIGDWLKTINNIEVNVNNLDDILQKFINHNEVLLTLQRVAATEVTKDPPINELNLESAFVRDLLNSKVDENEWVLQKMCDYTVGLAYINIEKLDENNKANEDLIYYFPKPIQKNILCTSRGMFITLGHLLQDITNSTTKVSSIYYKGKLAHVVYTKIHKNLLLLLLPDERASVKEVMLMNSELIRFMEFSFKNVDGCFAWRRSCEQMDRTLFRYFARILCNTDWATTDQFMEYQFDENNDNNPNECLFEQVMPVVPTLKLHDDAITQIDDALSELEASDYREWNEDPLDCQRLFTILGSALFHSGYLLHSHMTPGDLVDVYNFCRYQGIMHLAKTEPVKSLVLWREVFPRSCRPDSLNNVTMPEGRRYLLLVGAGKDFLAVIMEAGGATEPPEENMGPDAFYVEEAQATLSHVQELGLSIVAERFLASNGGFQIATPLPVLKGKKNDFIGSLGFSKVNVPQTSNKESNPNPKKNEVTSILKRRSSEQNVNTSQEDSYDAYSEGSESQSYNESMSEISDESSSRNRRVKNDSNDEDSDFDDYADGSQISTSSLDLTEIRQSLLSDLGEYSPIQLTSGRYNVLYHFVHIDATEGMLVTPLEFNQKSPTYQLILNNFRRCCQSIHDIFQSTLKFKRNLSLSNIPTHKQESSLTTFIKFTAKINSDSDAEMPPEILEAATLCLIPEKSLPRYNKEYELLGSWCRSKNMSLSALKEESLPAQDIGKSLMNKSLIAIKEYGMLFDCPFNDGVKDANSKRARTSYWVVGRLFHTPHPKELYICYEDAVPQNLVELAFKINLNSIL